MDARAISSLVTRTADRGLANRGDDLMRTGVRKQKPGGYRSAGRDPSASRTRRTYAR